MAVRTFDQRLNGDPATKNDWTNTANWGGGNLPAGIDQDDVKIVYADVDVTQNLQGLVAVAPLSLAVGNSVISSFGDNAGAGPMEFADIGEMSFDSRGNAFYLRSTGTIGDCQVINGSGREDMLHVTVALAITSLRVQGGVGVVTIDGATIINDITVNDAPSATLEIGSGVLVYERLTQTSGVVNSFANSGGVDPLVLVSNRGVFNALGTSTYTNVCVKPNSVLNYLSEGDVSELLEVYGLFDGRQNVNAGPIQINNAIVFENGEINVLSALDNFEFAPGVVMNGGIFIPHPGTVLALA